MRLFHIKPLLDLRWRLEYNDGTAPKWGQWTRPSNDIKEMVAFKRKDNLARAFIEVRDKRTFKTSVPVHCSGQDFVMFKWEYIARMGAALNTKIIEHKPLLQVCGLKLITRELEALVRVDGRPPIIVTRSEKEKAFHYEGFGK